MTNADNFNEEEFLKLYSISKSISGFLNKKPLIQFIIKLIDDTPELKFERAIDKKYISPNRPAMNLVFAELPEDLVQKEFDSYGYKKIVDKRSMFISSKLITPFSDLYRDIVVYITTGEINEKNEAILKEVVNLDDIDSDFSNLLDVEIVDEVIKYITGTASAITFSHPENLDINDDTGFTIEFLF